MSDVAIRVEGLGKRYRIGARQKYKALRDTMTDALYAPFRAAASLFNGRNKAGDNGQPDDTHIWALKDVSFDVKRGEVVGVIGRNGAGKSTLLKILSRITEPTAGRAEVYGRIGSLLEVGTGFHPELTGRENIYLNGAILGMRKAEIVRKFDEIVDFSEIEKFIDTPVKHYSSGMYVRLAFAVAAHLEPEILLVDEVLAVGDAAFQKKCLGKMGDVAKEGRTVLFVSHNMRAVQRLCPRSVLLGGGIIILDDSSCIVINSYLSDSLHTRNTWSREGSMPSCKELVFTNISACQEQESPGRLFRADKPITITIRYIVSRPLDACQIGLRIHNAEGLPIFTTADSDASGTSALQKMPGSHRACVHIPEHFLAPGMYSLVVGAHLPGRNSYDRLDDVVTFEIAPEYSVKSLDDRLGLVAPLIKWQITKEP